MTRTALIAHIKSQKVLATRNLRKAGWPYARIMRIEDGIILRNNTTIFCYYNEPTHVWVQLAPMGGELDLYKDEFNSKLFTSEHPIDVQIYTFDTRYPLRDNCMHVWIDYNAIQWSEIHALDFAPLLYDLDVVQSSSFVHV